MNIFDFEIPAHATRREWAVYIIVATNKSDKKKFLYVGKVGDNREGCNPIISRIGNHFSHNKIHSQLRNKISNTTEFNYKVHYCTFGIYDQLTHSTDIEKINEIERKLNTCVQAEIIDKTDNFELLNIYKGVGVNKIKRDKREKLLTQENIDSLMKLVKNALT
jgi:hypothetical protein